MGLRVEGVKLWLMTWKYASRLTKGILGTDLVSDAIWIDCDYKIMAVFSFILKWLTFWSSNCLTSLSLNDYPVLYFNHELSTRMVCVLCRTLTWAVRVVVMCFAETVVVVRMGRPSGGVIETVRCVGKRMTTSRRLSLSQMLIVALTWPINEWKSEYRPNEQIEKQRREQYRVSVYQYLVVFRLGLSIFLM